MSEKIEEYLSRIADALERLTPQQEECYEINDHDAYVFEPQKHRLRPVDNLSYVPVSLLCGIDRQIDILLANTLQFAKGLPANNALLWGSRGMGKSSLVKAAYAEVQEQLPGSLCLIEIHREDLENLPVLLQQLATSKKQVLLFCDDLSFDHGESSYKSLKAVLEGGLEGKPENVLFYATSNRRHLLPRHMIENERATAINPNESTEEKVSLSDRFGLWLGFHSSDQQTYLNMVQRYAKHFGILMEEKDLRHQALEWATTRGNRSGRVAWQFIQNLRGSRLA